MYLYMKLWYEEESTPSDQSDLRIDANTSRDVFSVYSRLHTNTPESAREGLPNELTSWGSCAKTEKRTEIDEKITNNELK